AGRRDHATRDVIGTAAGAVRDLPPPRLLLRDGARAHRHPLGGHPGIARRRGGGARDRAPCPRNAAHREPSAAPRAGLRPRPRPPRDARGVSPPRQGAARVGGTGGPVRVSGVHDIGRMLVVFGLLIALVGVALVLVGRVPWLGRLPGDIHIQRGNWTFYFPLA